MPRAAAVFVAALALVVFGPAAAADAAGASWSVSPPSYEFAPRTIGSGPSAPAVFELTNTGSVRLRAPSLSFSGLIGGENEPLDSAEFRVQVGCTSIVPGESCPIEVTSEAVKPGHTIERIYLVEPEHQVDSVFLALTASTAEPAISFSPPLLSLPRRPLGIELNPPQVLTVTDSGIADLHISSLSLGNLGTDPVNPGQMKIVGGRCPRIPRQRAERRICRRASVGHRPRHRRH